MMEETTLLSLLKGCALNRSRSPKMVWSSQLLLLLPCRVVHCALKHHHRFIAIIAGACVMLLVQAVVSNFSSRFASSPVATPTASAKSSQSVCCLCRAMGQDDYPILPADYL